MQPLSKRSLNYQGIETDYGIQSFNHSQYISASETQQQLNAYNSKSHSSIEITPISQPQQLAQFKGFMPINYDY